MLKRRREGKTDYRVRKALLLSRMPYLVPRISGRHTSVQFISPSLEGDRIVASADSKDLAEMGWRGSGKSIPGAYLTGLLAGLKASKSGLEKVILYVGVKPYTRGSRMAAVLKGVKDAGVSVPADEESLPSEERMRGEHIAGYAKSLLNEGVAVYKARFSKLLKGGLRPEEYPIHFEEVRRKIMKIYGVKTGE